MNTEITGCQFDQNGPHNFQAIDSNRIFCTKCAASVKLIDQGEAKPTTA